MFLSELQKSVVTEIKNENFSRVQNYRIEIEAKLSTMSHISFKPCKMRLLYGVFLEFGCQTVQFFAKFHNFSSISVHVLF